jgi:hypothetical protein
MTLSEKKTSTEQKKEVKDRIDASQLRSILWVELNGNDELKVEVIEKSQILSYPLREGKVQ